MQMRVSNAHQPGKRIYGQISYPQESEGCSSWLLQYYDSGRVLTVDLGIESTEAVMAAIADAAEYLQCRPENIQVSEHPITETEPREESPASRVHLENVRGVSEPRARIYFAEEDVLHPGWYVQFYADDRLDRLPLWQADFENVEAARTEAAWLLGCRPEEIQIGGELLGWPERDR